MSIVAFTPESKEAKIKKKNVRKKKKKKDIIGPIQGDLQTQSHLIINNRVLWVSHYDFPLFKVEENDTV